MVCRSQLRLLYVVLNGWRVLGLLLRLVIVSCSRSNVGNVLGIANGNVDCDSSNLNEEIFLQPPNSVPSAPAPGTVWLLKKAWYGLKQASLEWFQMLRNHIKSIGYSQSGYDLCLYVRDSCHFIVVLSSDWDATIRYDVAPR